MALRRLYFLISMTLYNLWILTRDGKEHPRAHEFKDWLEIELIMHKVLKKTEPNHRPSQPSPRETEANPSAKGVHHNKNSKAKTQPVKDQRPTNALLNTLQQPLKITKKKNSNSDGREIPPA